MKVKNKEECKIVHFNILDFNIKENCSYTHPHCDRGSLSWDRLPVGPEWHCEGAHYVVLRNDCDLCRALGIQDVQDVQNDPVHQAATKVTPNLATVVPCSLHAWMACDPKTNKKHYYKVCFLLNLQKELKASIWTLYTIFKFLNKRQVLLSALETWS